MRIIGLDPGLRNTGFGVIEKNGNRLSFIACGVLKSDEHLPLAERLAGIFNQVMRTLEEWLPDEAAVEETFVNKNPHSTLMLGQARGVVMLAPAQRLIPVFEYSPNLIKKTVVGTGHATKEQVALMVRTLLPGSGTKAGDASDALAAAICHAHQPNWNT